MSGKMAVITGCGVVAPNGIGRDRFARSLAEGRSGIGDLVSFDASDTGRERAAEILNFDPESFLRSPKNYLDRHSALGLAACEMAVRDSGIGVPGPDEGRGVCVGSMGGNLETLAVFQSRVQEKGPRLAPPFLFPHTYYNTTAGLLSIEYGLTGPHMQFCSGAAASLEAVAYAARCIENGRTRVILAGGAEAFNEWLFRVSIGRGWLSSPNGGQETCCPFGKDRNGSILGEGAAFFAVELPEAAQARGARVLARIRGCAVASSAEEAMLRALNSATMQPPSVDAIFASAGGYIEEDEAEALALAKIQGGGGIPVVGLKALIGETLGASGALNLAAAIAAMEQGVLPPVPGAARCAFDWLDLVHEPRHAEIRAVMVNAGSPGAGHWVSLVISKGIAGE